MKGSLDWQLVKLAFNDFKRGAGWGSPINPPDIADHLNEIIDIEWSDTANNTAGSYGVDYWLDDVTFF